jgi:hypothetical protein
MLFTSKRYFRRTTDYNEYDLNQTLVIVLANFIILPVGEIFLSDFLFTKYFWKSIIKVAVKNPIISLDFILKHV